MSGRNAENDAPEPMHRWVEPHGDLTACGIRWWNGTRGDEPVTCPACITGGHYEWRAVFSYPSSTPDTYGPPRNSEVETEQDRPWRPEESHGWRSGTQRRTVTEWRDVREVPRCRTCMGSGWTGSRHGTPSCEHFHCPCGAPCAVDRAEGCTGARTLPT